MRRTHARCAREQRRRARIHTTWARTARVRTHAAGAKAARMRMQGACACIWCVCAWTTPCAGAGQAHPPSVGATITTEGTASGVRGAGASWAAHTRPHTREGRGSARGRACRARGRCARAHAGCVPLHGARAHAWCVRRHGARTHSWCVYIQCARVITAWCLRTRGARAYAHGASGHACNRRHGESGVNACSDFPAPVCGQARCAHVYAACRERAHAGHARLDGGCAHAEYVRMDG
eukprot:1443-Pleurochrysis_carterae.AAC.2